MEINKSLSIVIPTYNRANFLDNSLEIHIPIICQYNIEIIIFDNNSDDATAEVVRKWSKEYAHIKYIKHDSNIGAVENFEFALKYPKTEYIWLLGDSYQFNLNNLKILFKIFEENQNDGLDIAVFNLDKKFKMKSKQYNDSNLLLYELGALMTCAAVSIINREIVQNDILKRYKITNFPHLGLMFEYLSNQESIRVEWIKESSITGLKNKELQKTNWSHTPKAFEIGCEDWTNFVMSLPPSYKVENKLKCIMDFGKVSGLFTFKNLLSLRSRGLLNIKVFNQYKKLFPFTIDYPLWLIFIISSIPIKLLNVFVSLYKGSKK